MTLKEKLVAFNAVVMFYVMDELELDEYVLEVPEAWKLPYILIEEYIFAIVFINDMTFDKEKMKEFFEYYLEKQVEYPEEYKIAEEEVKIANYIIQKEILEQRFWNSVFVLIKTNAVPKNKFSKFILEKAKEFIENSESKKISELSPENLAIKVKEGFKIIYFDR